MNSLHEEKVFLDINFKRNTLNFTSRNLTQNGNTLKKLKGRFVIGIHFSTIKKNNNDFVAEIAY